MHVFRVGVQGGFARQRVAGGGDVKQAGLIGSTDRLGLGLSTGVRKDRVEDRRVVGGVHSRIGGWGPICEDTRPARHSPWNKRSLSLDEGTIIGEGHYCLRNTIIGYRGTRFVWLIGHYRCKRAISFKKGHYHWTRSRSCKKTLSLVKGIDLIVLGGHYLWKRTRTVIIGRGHFRNEDFLEFTCPNRPAGGVVTAISQLLTLR